LGGGEGTNSWAKVCPARKKSAMSNGRLRFMSEVNSPESFRGCRNHVKRFINRP
jgi:hypothetical protein